MYKEHYDIRLMLSTDVFFVYICILYIFKIYIVNNYFDKIVIVQYFTEL